MSARHRAVVRAGSAGPARTSDETRLETTQIRLARATREVARLTTERDAIALHMWLDARVPQAEIAERLDRADRRGGGDGVTYAATQKLLWRRRQRVDSAAAV